MIVGRTFWQSSSVVSRDSAIASEPPDTTVTYKSHVRAKMWLRGRNPSRISELREPSWRATAVALDTRFRWLSITPLGSPVVPDVYKIVAKSSDAKRDSTAFS